MYDPCGLGETLKKYVFLNLGTWHTYKHASLLVWRRFAPVFLAGLYHELYPNSGFYLKPRLAAVTQMLVIVRMAYPRFRDQLKDALLLDGLQPQARICLQNLHDLCEFYIPVVQLCVFVGSIHAHLFTYVRCMTIRSRANWTTGRE
jgi:hypothetical protein